MSHKITTDSQRLEEFLRGLVDEFSRSAKEGEQILGVLLRLKMCGLQNDGGFFVTLASFTRELREALIDFETHWIRFNGE